MILTDIESIGNGIRRHSRPPDGVAGAEIPSVLVKRHDRLLGGVRRVDRLGGFVDVRGPPGAVIGSAEAAAIERRRWPCLAGGCCGGVRTRAAKQEVGPAPDHGPVEEFVAAGLDPSFHERVSCRAS